MAVANYEGVSKHYPQAYIADAKGQPMHSWRVSILPYMEQDALYKQYLMTEAWNGSSNSQLGGSMPRSYAFSGSHKPGLTVTSYLAVVGDETLWQGSKKITEREVKDDRSSTIMIVENRPGVFWLEPRDLNFGEMSMQIGNSAGISSKYKTAAVVMLDGSVRTLEKSLAPTVLRAMLTINGGEKIDESTGDWQIIDDGRKRELDNP